jgi:hypothetical protein
MPLQCTDSVDSTCTVLSCSPEHFLSFFNNKSLNTNKLVHDALKNIVDRRNEELRNADPQWKLDKFLAAMLEEGPNEDGRRYVAVALHIAHKMEKSGENPQAVIDMAKAWKEHLFRPSSFLK